MLPSQEESKRLYGLLKNCTVRCFKENGHTLLLVSIFIRGMLVTILFVQFTITTTHIVPGR